jgi:hypothetical protein
MFNKSYIASNIFSRYMFHILTGASLFTCTPATVTGGIELRVRLVGSK